MKKVKDTVQQGKRIISLDLGSKMGVAWGDGNRPDGHEMVKFTGKGGFNPESFYKFYLYLNNKVQMELSSSFEDVHLVIEKPNAHMPGYAGVKVHFGMLGVALLIEGRWSRVTSHVVPALTIKKFWTGSGRAKKPDMIAEAQKRGYELVDDNQADAVALYVYAQEVLFGNK
jgi:hypothetical protein